MRWLLVTLILLTAAPAGAQPRLVIGPPGLAACRAPFAHPEQWPQSRAWHIRIELDVGAIREWGPKAYATFAAEQRIWERLTRLGAGVATDQSLTASRALLHRVDVYAGERRARSIAKLHDIDPSSFGRPAPRGGQVARDVEAGLPTPPEQGGRCSSARV
jgi:hypothetical protein